MRTLTETLRRGRGTRDWMIHSDYCSALRAGGIVAAGYTHLGLNYEMIRVNPVHANIVICCDGELNYLIDGQWRTAAPGSVLIAPHAQPHGVRTLHASALTAWVAFEPMHAGAARLWDSHQTRLAGTKDHRPLLWALQGLYLESTGIRQAGALGHWADLVITAATRLADEKSNENAAIQQVWEIVDADLGHPWSAETIAELANFSASHFRRLCRQQLGHSLAQHLTRLRMVRAAMLLKTTDQKLSVISATVGYQNVFAFSVAFKRTMGTSPAEYRSTANPS